MILRESMATTALGIAGGTLFALYVSRFVGGLLFEVNAFDPRFFSAAAVLLGATALLATWIPARRGMRLSPTIAMRME